MAEGEAEKTPPIMICDEDPHFRDWDFWVGEWDVTVRETGEVAGENSIVKIESGCALRETWVSAGDGSGTSVNYYNPVTQKWRQIWIAKPGYLIDIEGGLQEGSMVLEGEITYYRPGTVAKFRGTWTPNEDGSVRQYFQQYDGEKKEWADWFDGHYVRKK